MNDSLLIATALPPMKIDPQTDVGRLMVSRGYDPNVPVPHRVFATRGLAHRITGTYGADPPTVLDFAGVEVASTPFIHELRIEWPGVAAENMNEDIAEAWTMVTERLG